MKKRGGRPSAYKPEMCEQVYQLCLLGATNLQIAEFFGLSESIIEKWPASHPEFGEAMRRGKLSADIAVAESLYKQATGFTRKRIEKHVDEKGKVTEIEHEDWIPPSTTACIFWLKNRARSSWTDTREISGKVKHDHEHRVEGVSDTTRWIEELVGSGAPAKDTTPVSH